MRPRINRYRALKQARTEVHLRNNRELEFKIAIKYGDIRLGIREIKIKKVADLHDTAEGV